MPYPAAEAAALAGRCLLAALFVHEAWSKITAYSAAIAYAKAFARSRDHPTHFGLGQVSTG